MFFGHLNWEDAALKDRRSWDKDHVPQSESVAVALTSV